jgi:asparagine synthase (glutamine-hydrolysing)
MTATLTHRGPDGAGIHCRANVGLGHRRLAVIDLSDTANQPLFNEDGTVAVVFNGEIYNFQALAEELRRAGHVFKTRSDTEVLVHAWEEFGPAMVERLRGMFAFAIYDSRRRQLYLARDRLGKKPLYYVVHEGQLAFASEIKALRALPDVSAELDLDAVAEYAAFGNTLGERSIWKDIRRLLPAHTMLLDLDAGPMTPRIERYWTVRPDPDHDPTEEEWIEELDRVISEAVRLRLISDVPLGAFLSGGIDSSLVVAYMTHHSTSPVKTFTMRFDEGTHDESGYAAAVARHLGTEHHSELVTQDAISELLNRLLATYDAPFADESALPTYYLSRMTRQRVTVALSGDGGDESFGGYNRYRYTEWFRRLRAGVTPIGHMLLSALAPRLRESSRLTRPLDRLAQPGFGLYLHAMGLSGSHLSLLRREVLDAVSPVEEGKMTRDGAALGDAAPLDRYAYTDLLNYLPDDVLVKVDRASMAHSLEVRSPLLDQEVVELAARIPAGRKVGMFKGKRILRTLLRRYVPVHLVDRPKMGFGVPISAWLRAGGPLLTEIERSITDADSPMWLYYDRDEVARRLRAHLTGGADLHVGLWRAVYFYRWCMATWS